MKTKKLYIIRDRKTSDPSFPATLSLKKPKSPNNQVIIEVEVVLPEISNWFLFFVELPFYVKELHTSTSYFPLPTSFPLSTIQIISVMFF